MKRVKECVETFRTHIRWSQEEGYAIVSLDVDLAAEILAQRDELAAQRDALLAACKALLEQEKWSWPYLPGVWTCPLCESHAEGEHGSGCPVELAQAAIARAEPEGEEATE